MKNGFKLKMIMKKAWEIARIAQAKFGGAVREYISEALKQAWQETGRNQWADAASKLLADLKSGAINLNVQPNQRRAMQGGAHWIGR